MSAKRGLGAVGTLQAQLSAAYREVERLTKEVSRLSVDALTGVAGRAVFERTLQTDFARAQRTKRPVGVLMLDVDHFKGVNDDYGHTVGDEVLREIAKAAAAHVRDSDLFARYGGEEFVAVVDGATKSGLLTLAERIRESVAALVFTNDAFADFRVTVSIGAALMNADDVEALDSIKRADAALYAAKRGGRDRVVFDHAD